MAPSFPWSNSYANLTPGFFEFCNPSVPPAPQLIQFNSELSSFLNLDLKAQSESDLAALFSGKVIPKGAQPLAMAYAGHQFGHFVPQLGDGRALLLGELLGQDGRRYDIQLKGAGQTPFSRRGDGKAALGPALREYILSEAMHHLGVPTTRALALVTTGETVYRETPMPGAVFTRVASSHLRIGTFEFFAARSDWKSVQILADYAIDRHFPELKEETNPYLMFLARVIELQTALIAKWMSLGFIHGVMNTDNMTISGETIDYGPCAFMDEFRFDQVFSSIDRQGRYSFQNQAAIARWNLSSLANCLVPLIDVDEKRAVELAREVLEPMPGLQEQAWLAAMRPKLGLSQSHPKDLELVTSWLGYLEKEKLDYTLSFRRLAPAIGNGLASAGFPLTNEGNNFFQAWSSRLAVEARDREEVETMMRKSNPIYIPRNHLVERAIQAGLNGDFSFFRKLNEVLRRPFEDLEGLSKFAQSPLPEERVRQTFCGT